MSCESWKILKDENTIEDHNIKDKETIEAYMSALGGMKDEESSASGTKEERYVRKRT